MFPSCFSDVLKETQLFHPPNVLQMTKGGMLTWNLVPNTSLAWYFGDAIGSWSS